MLSRMSLFEKIFTPKSYILCEENNIFKNIHIIYIYDDEDSKIT